MGVVRIIDIIYGTGLAQYLPIYAPYMLFTFLKKNIMCYIKEENKIE